MNLSIKTLSTLSVLSLLIYSCNKDDIITTSETNSTECELEIVLEPVCSFDAEQYPGVKFPVRVIQNGLVLTHPDYDFLWDIDTSFSGAAISVSYSDLPLSVIVTEDSTQCEGQAILNTDYWD